MAGTNVVSTTTTTISNLETGTASGTQYEGLLKDVYLPGLTDTVFNDPSFSGLIKRSSGQIDYKGQKIIRGFKTQRGGGVGAFAEGGDFVTNVPMGGEQGYEKLKYLNAYFSLTGPTIKAAKQGAGSFVDVVSDTFDDVITNAKNDFERQIVGDGTGKVCELTDSDRSGDGAGAAYEVTGDAYFDTQFLIEGQKYEVVTMDYTDTTTFIVRRTYDVTNYEVTAGTLTKGNKYASTAVRGTVAWDEAILDGGEHDASVTSDQKIIVIRSKAYTGVASAGCLEINGLQNLVTDAGDHSGDTDGMNEETATVFANTWNRALSTHGYLKSNVQSVQGELDEETLLAWLMDMRYSYQANPNLLVVSPRAMLRFFSNEMDTPRRFNTMEAIEWTAGYKGMGIQLGDRKLMLTSIGSLPSSKAFMINTNDFAFAEMTNGYEWVNQGGGRVLTQKEGSDNKFAAAVSYMNMVCNDPQRQLKAYGIWTTSTS